MDSGKLLLVNTDQKFVPSMELNFSSELHSEQESKNIISLS